MAMLQLVSQLGLARPLYSAITIEALSMRINNSKSEYVSL